MYIRSSDPAKAEEIGRIQTTNGRQRERTSTAALKPEQQPHETRAAAVPSATTSTFYCRWTSLCMHSQVFGSNLVGRIAASYVGGGKRTDRVLQSPRSFAYSVFLG